MSEKLRRVPSLWGTLWVLTFCLGCASTAEQSIKSSPLDSEHQQQAVLDIAPLGTPRADVERQLKEAGIELSSGAGPSICYCTLWNRANGERWQMDVALLFDQSGKLYATRRAQSETTFEEDRESPKDSRARREERDSERFGDRASPFSSGGTVAGDASGYQSPFASGSSLRK